MAFIFATQNPGRGKLSWHLPDSWLDYFFPSPPFLESSALQSLCLFAFLFRPLPGSGPRPSLSSLHGPYPHLIEHRQTHPHPWLAGAPLATSSYVFPLPLQFQPLNWFGFHFILHFLDYCNFIKNYFMILIIFLFNSIILSKLHPFMYYLFLAVLGFSCCVGFSLVSARGGCSTCRLLIEMASLVAEHSL